MVKPIDNIKVCVFDFDGVFNPNADGLHKPNAYDAVLRVVYGDRYLDALEVASTMYGYGKPGGRREILGEVFKRLGEKEDAIPALVEKASADFDAYVQEKIIEDGLTPGALELLETLKKRGLPLYLNSGTATSALVRSAENLGIAAYFAGILGSTKEPIGGSKVENLTHASHETGFDFPQILMVGDGDSDMKAAVELGCPFIGVANRWNGWGKEDKPFPLVTDLREILQYL